MKTYKVLFFGSPDFALPSLKAIHEHPRLELLAVVTQPDRPAGRKMKLQPTAVKAAALDLGLQVFDPPSVNSPEVLEALASFRADAAVVVVDASFSQEA